MNDKITLEEALESFDKLSEAFLIAAPTENGKIALYFQGEEKQLTCLVQLINENVLKMKTHNSKRLS